MKNRSTITIGLTRRCEDASESLYAESMCVFVKQVMMTVSACIDYIMVCVSWIYSWIQCTCVTYVTKDNVHILLTSAQSSHCHIKQITSRKSHLHIQCLSLAAWNLKKTCGRYPFDNPNRRYCSFFSLSNDHKLICIYSRVIKWEIVELARLV